MVILHFPIDISFCRILPMLNNARITKHNRMAQHIAVNISIRRNQHIIPYSYLTNDSNVCILSTQIPQKERINFLFSAKEFPYLKLDEIYSA